MVKTFVFACAVVLGGACSSGSAGGVPVEAGAADGADGADVGVGPDVVSDVTLDAPSDDAAASCGDPEAMMPAWATGFVPTQEVYVSPSGVDTNDGSKAHPLKTGAAALTKLAPGVRLNFMAGSYTGDLYIPNFAGTQAQPGAIRSSDGPRMAKLIGSIYLSKATYMLIDGVELSGSTGHGIQIDSGAPFNPASLSGNIVVHGSYIHDTGLASIKVAQSEFITVIGNELAKAAPGRQNVEFVAVSDTVVAGNYGHDSDAFNEVKGGAQRAVIARNRVEDMGGILVGGDCTGAQFLIDPTVDYEAKSVLVWGNTITGGGFMAFRVVGCHDCLVANNTFWAPQPAAVLRLIHDAFASGEGGGSCDIMLHNQNVQIENNIFASQSLPTYVIANNDAASAFSLSHNLWFSTAGDITKVGSDLPFANEPTSLYADPQLVMPPSDLSLKPTSPAIGKGIALSQVPGNAKGMCWTGAPDIGAY